MKTIRHHLSHCWGIMILAANVTPAFAGLFNGDFSAAGFSQAETNDPAAIQDRLAVTNEVDGGAVFAVCVTGKF